LEKLKNVHPISQKYIFYALPLGYIIYWTARGTLMEKSYLGARLLSHRKMIFANTIPIRTILGLIFG
jgi:hypothetical protein